MDKKVLKNRILYILFNSLFALPLLLIGILGMSLLNIILYGIGIALVFYGIISFFPSIVVKIGIFDRFGNEYVATNLFYRIGVLVATIIAAGMIAYLPDFLGEMELMLFIFLVISGVAVGLGVMLANENTRFYISPLTREIGLLVPMAYVLAGAMFILDLAFGIGAWLRILVMVLAFAFHVLRCYLVFTQAAFR
ncbi:MAG: hypothetical protein J6Q85_01705 [Clostridia bacterium]|nr:hypothetical protein [Clostridia bacterium]